MANKSIAWILKFTSELPNDEEKIKCLQANERVVKEILRYAFDPSVKFLLPEGAPPYKPSPEKYNEDAFYHEVRKLYLFIEGGNNDLKPARREFLFLDVLQAIHPDDAELLIAVKDKKLPWEGITSKLVLKAFPGLYADK